ncbi:MAG: 16S rRNA (adenine(1518)-N(6)/adenine(1519)-N(6))-dimethyltransferase RsmA [Clostridia bacterium]|nr:16S rRNA (adenine(1518)-N(6)/adenine(1519)-N(6))-dimethyltransferase RsmA [Clostridia bacterium]
MQNLSDASVVKDLLSRHGFKFSKALGQNFLINPTVCPRMAEVCGADESTGVIEVGPGFGVLTAELAKKAKKVVSIELDERLLPVLDETLAEFDNVKIINADVLKVDLKKIIEEEFAGIKVAVCANLPYYITSPVIMHLLESRLPIENLTVMVQKEAAQRLCAPVGSREAGAVTVAVDYYSDAKKAFDVSAGSFMPAPKVDSSVIKLDIRKQPPVELKDEKLFFRMVKAVFAQRRKTAANSISAGMSLPKETVYAAIAQAGYAETVRAESFTREELAVLANAIYNITKQ